MICPCADCERKGCGAFHDQCEKYLDWLKTKRAYNKQKVIDKRRAGRVEYLKRGAFAGRANKIFKTHKR